MDMFQAIIMLAFRSNLLKIVIYTLILTQDHSENIMFFRMLTAVGRKMPVMQCMNCVDQT